ncbi:MAG: hypothetical protein ACHQT8_08100, partial [Chlamydiales bacterium]
RRAILDLVGVQLSIDAINASRIQKYAISALTLLTSGICISAEALISSTLIMTAGKTLAEAAVAKALVTFFWHWSDTARLRQSYSAILRGGVHSSGRPGLADIILQNLPRLHHANMSLVTKVNDIQLRPLYPEFFVQWHHEMPRQ